MSEINRVWRLRKRPVGEIGDDVLSLEEEPLPQARDGEFVFRMNYLSLDPTNRIWMSDMDQYMPPVELGAPMRGIVCGTVVESRHPDFAVGDRVSGLGVWADYQVGPSARIGRMAAFEGISMPEAFGTFVGVGPTAYIGLLDFGEPREGETVVVSAAAGAVGSLVGQIARIHGCRAVGLAGSDEKCAWLTGELGFDAAINYKTANVPEALAAACPDGIDIYFDNVGGPILDACLKRMNLKGRVVTCGLISMYNATEPVPGPYNYPMILMQRLRVQGFIVSDHLDRYPAAIRALSGWIKSGQLRIRVDIDDGLEHALTPLRKLYSGANTGKLLVRVHDP